MFTINFQSRTPVYRQIYDEVIRLVSFGAIKAGDKLPPVRVLAAELGINPNTAARAYTMLENHGYIYSCVGRGSFVSSKLADGEADRLKARKNFIEAVKESLKTGVAEDDMKEIIAKIYHGGDRND